MFSLDPVKKLSTQMTCVGARDAQGEQPIGGDVHGRHG